MNKKSILSAAILSTIATGAYAFDSSRISGEIILGTGYMSTNSNLSTKSDAHLTNKYNKGSRNDEFFAMPLGSISYELGAERNQRVYLGTSRDDLAVGDLAFEIGYQYDMQNGTQIDVAYLPTVVSGEVWKDPYATNRSETDVEGDAFRIKLSNIVGSGFSLDMGYATTEVDDEQINSDGNRSELLRDSDMYYLKGSYDMYFAPNMGLTTSMGYLHNDAEGSAETFDQYELEVTYFVNINAHTLALTSSYAYRDYEGGNSHFENKTRTDNRHKFFAAYEYTNIAGLKNWNLISLAGINYNDSNINFYESVEYIASVGVSYKF